MKNLFKAALLLRDPFQKVFVELFDGNDSDPVETPGIEVNKFFCLLE